MKALALFLLPMGGPAVLAMPAPPRANQFVLFDVTFTYTKEDADTSTPSKSHYYVKGDRLSKDRPKDWTSPVDYRNGTVHIRTEVIEKPAGGQPTTWNLCYIPNKGQKNGYGCTTTGIYKEKGVYDVDVSMTSFWQNDSIVWSEGIKRMDLVLKDDNNLHAHKRPDPEKFFPTKVRITMVQVAAGSKYDPSLVRQTISTLPPGFAGSNFCSEVLASADGRFVYAGNRLNDSIGIFAVGSNGDLAYVGEEWTRGN